MKAADRICAALDFGHWRAAEPFAQAIAPQVGMLKVGLEMFSAEGPSARENVRVIESFAIRPPRLLLLAYYFPPASKIGGIRAFNMAKSLSARGWDVTVVSPAVSMWRAVERNDEVTRDLERETIRCIRTGHKWRNLSPGDLACRDKGLAWIWGGICRRTARA